MARVRSTLTAAETAEIHRAVEFFAANTNRFDTLAQNLLNVLVNDKRLNKLIHSSKYRVKDPDHLQDKLFRKAIEAKSKGHRPSITAANLYTSVGDLAGVRLLHLHTQQFRAIHEAVEDILSEERYAIIEGPIANTWNDEYRAFFDGLGVATAPRDSLYTSVHYVIESSSRSQLRCELQVRTLMEEVWGEVSHIINYPHETKSVACKEQLKVLARVTSACTRLVDSLFQSKHEHDSFA
jgi:ppGpp synthetase/RelA/SpoT-type nucleotidyltranferase